MEKNNLMELALKYGSDKCAGKHNYIPTYEGLFKPFRHRKPMNILELGVANGASIKMWLEYFPNADIYGIDGNINPGINDERYTHIIGNQTDYRIYDMLLTTLYYKNNLPIVIFEEQNSKFTPLKHVKNNELPKFDIIIDDCSHFTENTIFSYVVLINHLSFNGFYIIEDCNYKYGKYTKEILGKYGEVIDVGRDAVIVIRGKN